jgi:hypothetical protein
MSVRITSFREFYPYYLSQHGGRGCRVLHFIGTSCALACLAGALLTLNPWYVLAALAFGYGFGWLGHALYEKNRPTTFSYPWYSLLADLRMYRDLWIGRQKF